jgi:hypothetical protein|nr:hypothetical protein [Phenylobacterium sp.]
MTDGQRLRLVRAIHTVIYVVMASASFVVLYAGVTGAHGRWLWLAAGLVTVETVVFTASGMRCPLTAIAVRNGATRGGVSDTFLPERVTRHTFRFFAPLILVAMALLAARFWWLGWR